jgi:hypothetical protein
MPRRVSLFAHLVLAALACALPVPAAEGEALLALAFARAEAAAGRNQAYRYHAQTCTRVSDGDDVLEHEEISWADAIQWGPDSTQTLAEGRELVYNRKAKPGEETKDDGKAKDDKKERKLDLSFDFFTAERRGEYRFEVGEAVQREGRLLAPVTLTPRQKKEGLWVGQLWLAPETGALVGAALKPAKGSFGLKRLDLTAALAEHAGQDLPQWIALDLEVKIPIVVHKHIRTRTEFSQLAPAP